MTKTMGGMGVATVCAPTPANHPIAYRPKDACRMIGCGKTKLRGLINSGELTVIKLGDKITLITHDQLEKLLAKQLAD
jgi:excisionase family DNA binding protein